MARLRLLAQWLVMSIVGLAIYLLWAAALSAQELLAGCISGALVATGITVVSRDAFSGLLPRVRDLALLPLTIPEVAVDTVTVSGVAIRLLLGAADGDSHLRSVAFPAGAGQAPGDARRRAAVVLLASISPNTIAVGIVRDRGALVVHQLRVRPPGAVLRRLGVAP